MADEEKVLNPSPKRVEGTANFEDHVSDLGDTYGDLHKPPLKIETKDGVRKEEAIVNKSPQVIDNRLGVASARKLILASLKDFVDAKGEPLLKNNVGDSVTVDEIDSESAPSGSTIASDGHGGAFWDSVPASKKHYLEEGDTIEDVLSELNVGDIYITDNKLAYLCIFVDNTTRVCIDAMDDGFYVEAWYRPDPNTPWESSYDIWMNPDIVAFLSDLSSKASDDANNVMIKPTISAEIDSQDAFKINVTCTKGYLPSRFALSVKRADNEEGILRFTLVNSSSGWSYNVTKSNPNVAVTIVGITFDDIESSIHLEDADSGNYSNVVVNFASFEAYSGMFEL